MNQPTMYWEEKVIEGILNWRAHPDANFKPYTPEELTEKVERLKKYVATIQETVLTFRLTDK